MITMETVYLYTIAAALAGAFLAGVYYERWYMTRKLERELHELSKKYLLEENGKR